MNRISFPVYVPCFDWSYIAIESWPVLGGREKACRYSAERRDACSAAETAHDLVAREARDRDMLARGALAGGHGDCIFLKL